MQYRTEIYVATDRYVCLQLPNYVPHGRAVVTVSFEEDDRDESGTDDEADDDRQDIEWWDDLDDEDARGD